MRKILLLVGFLHLTCSFAIAQNKLDHIYFKTASSQLSSDAKKNLNRFIQSFDPSTSAYIEVVGHTDNIGTETYNEALALRRAESVRDYFLGKGLDADKILIKTFGESQPLVSNREEKGRMQNRRVSFAFGDGSFAWLKVGQSHSEELLSGLEFLGEVAPYEYNEREIAMREFAASLAPDPQNFWIKYGRETRIKTKNGVVIFVPNNVFETISGERPIDRPRIEIREFVNRSDMMMMGLDTYSPYGILESGGMFQILAFSGNEPLKLKEGRKIEIHIPTLEVKEGMGLFTTEISPPGNNNLLNDWVFDSLGTIPDQSRIGSVEHKWWVNQKESEGPGISETDESIVEIWGDTLWQEGQATIIDKTYRVRKNRPEMKYLINPQRPNFYRITSGRLGWINCDRFRGDMRPKTEVLAKMEDERPMIINFIFKNINSVMGARGVQGN
ncbi:MAG: OmpA family protein, partial [Bacteroidota bacterium]